MAENAGNERYERFEGSLESDADERRKAVLRYLGRPKKIENQIRRKKEKIRDLRSSLTSISVNYSDMPKNPSGPASRLEEAMVEIVDLEREIEELAEHKAKRVDDIVKAIGDLQDGDAQRILIALFVKGMTWDEAVECMGFGRRKFSELRNAGIKALCSRHMHNAIFDDQVEGVCDEKRMQDDS